MTQLAFLNYFGVEIQKRGMMLQEFNRQQKLFLYGHWDNKNKRDNICLHANRPQETVESVVLSKGAQSFCSFNGCPAKKFLFREH